jgi:hypothetical protein
MTATAKQVGTNIRTATGGNKPLAKPAFVYRVRKVYGPEKVYVGVSNNPQRRFAQHMAKSSNPRLRNAVKKYGETGFTYELLSGPYHTTVDLDYAEVEAIEFEITRLGKDRVYNNSPGGGRLDVLAANRASTTLPPEKLIARAVKASKTKGVDGRRAAMRKAKETMGHERRSAASAKGHRNRTAETRRVTTKKRLETLGPDGLRAAAAKRVANMGPAGRKASSRKGKETMGPERRRAAAKKGAVTLGFERRSANARQAATTKGRERLSEIARARQANKTPEARRAFAQAGAAGARGECFARKWLKIMAGVADPAQPDYFALAENDPTGKYLQRRLEKQEWAAIYG